MSDSDAVHAILSCAAGTYTVSIPELGIIVTDADAGNAYREAVTRRAKVIAEFTAAGLADRLTPVARVLPRPALGSELGLFAIKALIAYLPILLVAVITVVGVRAILPAPPSMHDLFAGLQARLASMADPTHDLSQQQIEEMRHNVRILVQRIKPIADELTPLAGESGTPADSASAPVHNK